jgi:glycosyltransferase involved in cell wall biosynthesis
MKRKLHICFVSPKAYQLFNPKVKSTFGGAEVQLSLLAKELSNYKDIKVDFMVADYGQKSIETYGLIKVWKSLNFKQNILYRALAFYRVFKIIDSDIYILRTLSLFSAIIAVYCKLKKKQLVYMIAHDNEVGGGFSFTNLISMTIFNFASLVIVQNDLQKDTLKRRFKIYSYLLKSSYEIENNKSQSKKGVLWVSRAIEWKRPEKFIQLAKHNPDLPFIMVCPVATNKQQYFNRIKKEAIKISNIEFYEFIPFDEIDSYFKDAKIFVNTSTQEGFPNTFIQSAKNQTPIVSLNVNPDNFLNEYNCGFYCNDDFDEMDLILNQLLNDVNLYGQMSENAYKYAKDSHDIKKNAKQFYDLIKDEFDAKK